MSLKCGIVGLPNVGKSTLFNALTSAGALAANFPFATKEPNIGIITVPDERLDTLAELVKPQKVIPTTVEIVDIAGLIKGASKGEGLGNQFLANIREVDAIMHVVRCFRDDNILHVDGSIDPVRDKEIIDTELQLKDLETIEKKMEKLKKNAKSGNKEDVEAANQIEALYNHIESGRSVRTFDRDLSKAEWYNEMMLLTAKPVMYVCNVDDASVNTGNEYTEQFRSAVKDENAEIILISAAIESEIIEMDDEEEKKEFLEALDLSEPGVNRVIRACYRLLDLQTYFTAGEKEVRAWTVPVGTKAPQAAGVIHTDFEKGFIRAEVISYQDYEQYGSENAIKEAGKMRIEGKDYIVKDGDVMHFRFNV
ncbi:MAG: redox-regulated ATPase YchF [Saprospiraceae bacterium]|nr:redox-regulated ATPase YchF [Saprospiraceae bacterium]